MEESNSDIFDPDRNHLITDPFTIDTYIQTTKFREKKFRKNLPSMHSHCIKRMTGNYFLDYQSSLVLQ